MLVEIVAFIKNNLTAFLDSKSFQKDKLVELASVNVVGSQADSKMDALKYRVDAEWSDYPQILLINVKDNVDTCGVKLFVSELIATLKHFNAISEVCSDQILLSTGVKRQHSDDFF